MKTGPKKKTVRKAGNMATCLLSIVFDIGPYINTITYIIRLDKRNQIIKLNLIDCIIPVQGVGIWV